VALGAPRGIPDDNQAIGQGSVTDDALFAVLTAPALHFKRQPLKDNRRVSEIKPSLSESFFTLGRIKTDLHVIIVATTIGLNKRH